MVFYLHFQALDVNYLLRKAATVSTPVVEITEENGVWSIKSSTTLKSMDLKFKVSYFRETISIEFCLQNFQIPDFVHNTNKKSMLNTSCDRLVLSLKKPPLMVEL